jgi:hypothetical protein
VDVEHAPFDQELVHGRVEIAVVHDVVDVAILVVIYPPRGDSHEVAELFPSGVTQDHAMSCLVNKTFILAPIVGDFFE